MLAAARPATHRAAGVRLGARMRGLKDRTRHRHRRRQRHRRGDRAPARRGRLRGRHLRPRCRRMARDGRGRDQGGRRPRQPARARHFRLRRGGARGRGLRGSAAGRIAFLVNNAGWDRAANFLDTTPEFWRKVIAINLDGPLNMNHVVLRGMAARGFGRVVNIASDAGRVGSSGEAVYSACKGGIIAFTKTLARELVGKGDHRQHALPRPDRHRDPAQLPRRPRRHPHRRRPQARHPDAPARRAGGLSRPGRVPALGRRRLHHRPDHQRVRRPHHARMTSR